MKIKDKAALIIAMLVFGTIGILRRYIPLTSGALAMLRGYIGAAVLAVIMLVRGSRLDMPVLRRNILKLMVSGAFIGFNWMLLFEAYNHTSVATATLCYYMAPVIVMIMSPFVLKERLTARKAVCIAAAIIGMVPVSGILSVDGFAAADLKGVAMALGAAVLYACVIFMNKRITEVKAMDRTIVQLFMAAAVVTPYAFGVERFSPLDLSWLSIMLVLVAGIVHTGIAYAMYFGAINSLRGQTVALLSYIDPIFAVVLSALVLNESMDAPGWIGAAVVIGAMMISEIPDKNK